MKLIHRKERNPIKDGYYFCVNKGAEVGLCLWKNGTWYSMTIPDKHPVDEGMEFYWVEFVVA